MIFVLLIAMMGSVSGGPLSMPASSLEIAPQFKVFHSLSGNNFSLLVEKKHPGHFCWGFGETMKAGDIFCVEFKEGDLTPTFSDCELIGKRRPKCVSPSVKWVLKEADLQPSESRVLVTRDISLESSWKIAPNENVFEWSFSDSPKIEPHKGKNKSFGSTTVKMNMGDLPTASSSPIAVASTSSQQPQQITMSSQFVQPSQPQQVIVTSISQPAQSLQPQQVLIQSTPAVTGSSQTANPVILVQSPTVLSQQAFSTARAQPIQSGFQTTQSGGNIVGQTVQQFANTVTRTFPAAAQTFQSARQSATALSQAVQLNSTSPTSKGAPFVTWEMIQKIFENKKGAFARCKFSNGACEPLDTGVVLLAWGTVFFLLGCL